ncbi:LutB/LldF family L-lactate oxidation iron-sulfur protein [Photobacterium leiognathi]|uniref:Iron-sulfur cluster-binding protein n=2 Tax=Photobacterium leiognathi TaxID=553611 RepID=A0A2T3MHX9_PHOLE|nr:LutB/LldF family L-lactate oxidation iron-sulfur protein [Photobacterium leiognathi]KJF94457.1 amino acid dehydrogenase [Photobacterium leiognathi]PSV03280.1 iron-sulfur cluster-binding protein [Photobacterium leiognathi subsp. mandapamensis]PSV13504.1 iron-sulfur cluster-binding protein [Photobacterium leiognathi subsp. mandapamensis]PSV93970.1 iron-sulfur cluster-binding protein [Photobacterium leiognathi]PSW42112.1 iron-sulfur cluster-binding protein [Photobacterium leiognathi subsp. man
MSMKTSNQKFKDRIHVKMKDESMRAAVANAQERMFKNRAIAAEKLGNWEEWREMGMDIRNHVLENLDYYLQQLSDNVEKNGGHVYFAATAEDATNYIEKIIQQKNAKKVVKSKSMVTEEIGMNHVIQRNNCEVIETDLGEYILQVDDCDAPSHIVVPALHKNRTQIRDVFNKKLGYEGSSDPEEMTRFVREHIRHDFLEAEIGITGCNFAIAESGTVTLVTNEGNARLATSLPKTHIAVMGMERIVPTFEEFDIVASLLCRSAVGLPLTGYVTALTGPREEGNCDGPEEFHLVIVDNGRSKILGSEFRSILRCVRCAACVNTCPAYRHIGGQSYGSIYSGPIGAVLSPLLGGYEDFKDLPNACSLCRACHDVCPVKIPLSDLLLKHRQIMGEEKITDPMERASVSGFSFVNAHPALWDKTVKIGAIVAGKLIKDGQLPFKVGLLNAWTQTRDLPTPSGESFRSWFKNKNK